MLKEFKEFALKGNVVDMAVGVIIGSAFGKIVASLVSDVIMPPIGLLVGNIDFSDLSWVIKQAEGTAKPVTLNYGLFINNVIGFLIVAFTIFLVIKGLSSLKKKQPAVAVAPTTKDCPQCQMNISIKAVRCPYCTSSLSATAG